MSLVWSDLSDSFTLPLQYQNNKNNHQDNWVDIHKKNIETPKPKKITLDANQVNKSDILKQMSLLQQQQQPQQPQQQQQQQTYHPPQQTHHPQQQLLPPQYSEPSFTYQNSSYQNTMPELPNQHRLSQNHKSLGYYQHFGEMNPYLTTQTRFNQPSKINLPKISNTIINKTNQSYENNWKIILLIYISVFLLLSC